MNASPVMSMTGFAVVRSDVFELSLKSVNHRFLDLHLRLPVTMEELAGPIRQLLKERMRRGHVELTLHLFANSAEPAEKGLTGSVPRLNHAVIEAYITQFRELARQHHLGSDPDVAGLLRLPGVVLMETQARAAESANGEEAMRQAAATQEGVLELLPSTIELLLQSRAAEGDALVKGLRDGMQRVAGLTAEARKLRAGARQMLFERTRMRLVELMGEAGGAGLNERILQEAAMLADRSDVEEELIRLKTHVEQFEALLAGGGEVGKRLDFLLQELNREANTLLSKTGGALGSAGLRLTEIGMEMKVELERAKEQVQNLE